MMICGTDINIHPFLSLEEENPLGIILGHDFGASFVTLEDFITESKIDLSPSMCHRYACAFEIIAKQLREEK